MSIDVRLTTVACVAGDVVGGVGLRRARSLVSSAIEQARLAGRNRASVELGLVVGGNRLDAGTRRTWEQLKAELIEQGYTVRMMDVAGHERGFNHDPIRYAESIGYTYQVLHFVMVVGWSKTTSQTT